MIKSFNHKGLKDFFYKGISKKIKPEHREKIKLILFLINNAEIVQDVNFPGSNLHKLKGRKKEFWSVNVSGNWRIIFKFEKSNVYNVDYIDYH